MKNKRHSSAQMDQHSVNLAGAVVKSCLESKGAVLFFMLMLVFFAASAQTTYKWNKTGTQSFIVAANWTPARTTPAATDILVFDGNGVAGTVTTVSNVPSQTIEGLLVSNNTSVTFTTPAAAGVYTLSINNGSAPADLSVAAGSLLNLAGTRATVIGLATGARAAIAGNMTLTNGAHQLLGSDASSVVFSSPAVFTASTGFTGYAFGNTGTANTTIFSTGTTYTATAGSDPFGLTAPAAKVVFNHGSIFKPRQAAGAGITLNGRTFGDINFNGSGTATLSGALGFTADSITVSTGTVNIAMTGPSSIKGNINVVRSATLNLVGTISALVLNGTTQVLWGGGALNLNSGQTVEIANGTTVNMLRGIVVTSASTALTVKGTLNTGASLVSGTGTFNLVSGAYLGIGSTGGITVAGTASGSIRTTVRNYSAGANYIYNGTANQATGNGLPATVNTLTINNRGTAPANIVGLTAAVAISGTVNSLYLQSGVVNLNNKQLTIPNGGTITAAGGNFNTTAGPVLFAGSGMVTGTVKFSTVAVAGPVNFGTASTINTSLQVNTGGSLVSNSPTYLSTATLIYTCGCTSFNTGLEWIAGSTAGAGVPANVTLNLSLPTNTLMLSGNRTVVNKLTLTNGNLSIGSNTLTLNAAVARTAGFLAGSHTSGLVIGGVAGNLYFASAGTGSYLKNFTLNSGATAALSTALNITGGTAPGTEGTLTVTGTATLTTRGFLTIKSNQYGTARIAEGRTTGGYVSGNVTVERYIPKNTNKAWRLLAVNTSGQTIKQAWQENQAVMLNGNPGYGTMIPGKATTLAAAQALGFDTLSPGSSLFKYNPVTDNLDPVLNTSSTRVNSEQGFFLFVRGDRSAGQMGLGSGNAATTATTLRSTGTIYQGNQTAISVPAGRWAVVRNPYASAIDLTKMVITGGLVDAYQVWDPKLNGVYNSGAFQTFTRSGANYVITPGGGSYGANGSISNVIESGSAFFVQATGTTGTVQVLENSKTSGSHLVQRPSGVLAGSERLLFNLYANNAGSTDLVDGGLIFFNDAYSNAVDVNDVRKSPNFSENIGILKNNTELVVEKRPTISTDDTIQFKMYQMHALTYTLQVMAQNLDQPGMTAFLIDKFLNSATPLNLNDTTTYDFTVNASPASYAEDRFKITFRPATVLPVSFIAVNAAPLHGKINVSWKVASQVNVHHYEIERSLNGRVFSSAGSVQAINKAQYNWLDENAVAGNNFYRIKSIDINGLASYSAVVKVTLEKTAAAITVSPNPVQGNTINVYFSDQEAGRYAVNLVNAAGQVVYKTALQHAGNNAAHPFSLPASVSNGIFQLVVTTPGNTVFSQRVIINK